MKVILYFLSNFADLYPNPWAFPVLAAGLYTAGLAFYIYAAKNANSSIFKYLLFSLCLSLYLIGAALGYMSRSPEAAYAWFVIANIGAVYLPHAILSTTGVLLGETPTLLRWRKILFIISTIFAVSLLSGHYHITGVRKLFWGWFPVFGSMGLLYLIYFALVMLVVLLNFILEYRGSGDTMQRQRMIISSVSLAVGLLAAVDFFPTFGIDIYAFGYIPMSVYVTLMGYAIMRFRLVDIAAENVAVPVLETMRGAVVVVDRSRFIRLANRYAHTINDLAYPSLLNQRIEAVPWLCTIDIDAPVLRTQTGLEVSWKDSEDKSHTVIVRGSDLYDSPRNTIGTVFVAQDISARKQVEYQLQQMASHDTLTGLPNRAYFLSYLEKILEIARRSNGHFALLFLDLNNFKDINDALGHNAGDKVLISSSQRIVSAIRSSDIAARMGGDEFVVLCTNIESSEDALQVAEKIIQYVVEPVVVGEDSPVPGVSIGVSLFPGNGNTPDQLVAAADTAMYAAKNAAKNGGKSVALAKS